MGGIKLCLRFLLFVAVCFFCGVVFMAGAMRWSDERAAGYVIYLKSGGDFTNYCKVSDSGDFDRAVNVRNISTLRMAEDRKLIVDGNIVILFDSNTKRAEFVNKVCAKK